MAPIEKSTLKITTVVMLIGGLTTGLTGYFSSSHGVENTVMSLDTKFQLQLKDVERRFEDKLNKTSTEIQLLKKDVESNEKRITRMEDAASSYISKAPQQERYRNYHQ